MSQEKKKPRIIPVTGAGRWNLSETLPHPIIMWVIEVTRSKVWMEVETPVKGSQDRWLIASVINQHLCSTVDIHSGHRWPALLLSNHLSSLLVFTSTPMWTLASSKEYSFSFKCRCTAGSYAAQVALLCCTRCLWVAVWFLLRLSTPHCICCVVQPVFGVFSLEWTRKFSCLLLHLSRG